MNVLGQRSRMLVILSHHFRQIKWSGILVLHSSLGVDVNQHEVNQSTVINKFTKKSLAVLLSYGKRDDLSLPMNYWIAERAERYPEEKLAKRNTLLVLCSNLETRNWLSSWPCSLGAACSSLGSINKKRSDARGYCSSHAARVRDPHTL